MCRRVCRSSRELLRGDAAVFTMTIQMDEDLKARVAAVAEREGKTIHAFVVDVVMQTVEQVEWDEEFHGIADERWARLQSTQEVVLLDELRAYVDARLRGQRPRKPAPRKIWR